MGPVEQVAEELSVDEALGSIQERGTGLVVVYCVAILSINSTAKALEANLQMYISDCIGAEWRVSDMQKASLLNSPIFGMILGTIIFNPLADIVGRRRVLLYTTQLLLLFAVLSAFAPSFTTLWILRMLVGVMEGAWTVSLDLLAEYVPSKRRGLCMNMTNLGWGLGAVCMSALARLVLPSYGWRALTLAAALPFAISAVSIAWLDESPHWLVSEGRVEEAYKVVTRIASLSGCEVPCSRLSVPMRASEDTGLLGQVSRERDRSLLYYHFRMLREYKTLLAPERFYLTLRVWVLWACWGFSYNAIVLLDGLVLNSGPTDEVCSFDYAFTFWISTAELVAVAAVAPFLDRADLGFLGGRRGMQVLPYGISAVMLLLSGADVRPAFVWAYLARLMLSAGANCSIIHTVELYHTSWRATATGAASIVCSLAALGASPLVYNYGHSPFFIASVIAGATTLGAATVCLTSETANRPLDA